MNTSGKKELVALGCGVSAEHLHEKYMNLLGDYENEVDVRRDGYKDEHKAYDTPKKYMTILT